MRACAVREFSTSGDFGFNWQRGKHMVSGFVSVQEADFHLPFHYFDSFHASFRTFVCIQCTKCQECRKTYYCVVVQRHEMMFFALYLVTSDQS